MKNMTRPCMDWNIERRNCILSSEKEYRIVMAFLHRSKEGMDLKKEAEEKARAGFGVKG